MTNLKNYLREQLLCELPGEKAHAEMIPGKRISAPEAVKNGLEYKESAVSVVLYPYEESHHCIFIKRPLYDGVHSGQIAFPGGRKENTDLDLVETAKRETHEEIRVELQKHELVGALSPVFIPVSGYMVNPYLFCLDTKPTMVPQEREVEQILTFSLGNITEDKHIKKTRIKTGKNTILTNVPCFEIENQIIWGATALILNELKHLIKTAPWQNP